MPFANWTKLDVHLDRYIGVGSFSSHFALTGIPYLPLGVWNNFQQVVTGYRNLVPGLNVVSDYELRWQVQIETAADSYHPPILSYRFALCQFSAHSCLVLLLSACVLRFNLTKRQFNSPSLAAQFEISPENRKSRRSFVDMNEELYTLKKAADALKYSERHMRQLCIDGKVDGAYRLTDRGKWLIPRTAVLHFSKGQPEPSTGRHKEEAYQSSLHQEKMRRLASGLINEISLPEKLHSFILDWKPQRLLVIDSRGNRLCPPVIIDKNGKISIELSLESDGEIGHVYHGLRSHLETAGSSQVLRDIDAWKKGAGQYIEKCHQFLTIAIGETREQAKIPDDKVERNEKTGCKLSFFKTACAAAVEIANGGSPVAYSGYCTQALPNNLWLLYKYSGGGICVAKTELGAKRCRHKHMELGLTLSKTEEAKEVARSRAELEKTEKIITKQLQKFSDMEPLPGDCELCADSVPSSQF